MTTRAHPWMPPTPPRGDGIRCTAELLRERSCLVCAHCSAGKYRGAELPAIETCPDWSEEEQEP